jgi:2-polyprenyl-3-methyl-5-hydroxy-6-metoxy-1,4-benzoquinol methylase
MHVWLRWRLAPFEAVEAALPRTGRIMEIGCGHGLLSRYAAAAAPERVILGTDVDPVKVGVAQRAAAAAGARVRFDVAAPGALPAGPWQGIAIVDVLYLLTPLAQQALLLAAAADLSPGGVLVVKEMGRTPRWKARWNRAQETFAVRVLGITHGSRLFFLPIEQVCRWLTDAGLVTQVRPLDRGYPHPHVLVVATKPLDTGAPRSQRPATRRAWPGPARGSSPRRPGPSSPS